MTRAAVTPTRPRSSRSRAACTAEPAGLRGTSSASGTRTATSPNGTELPGRRHRATNSVRKAAKPAGIRLTKSDADEETGQGGEVGYGSATSSARERRCRSPRARGLIAACWASPLSHGPSCHPGGRARAERRSGPHPRAFATRMSPEGAGQHVAVVYTGSSGHSWSGLVRSGTGPSRPRPGRRLILQHFIKTITRRAVADQHHVTRSFWVRPEDAVNRVAVFTSQPLQAA